MKGICGTNAFGHIPCVSDQPPEPVVDSEALATLSEICPNLVSQASSGLCCDKDQITVEFCCVFQPLRHKTHFSAFAGHERLVRALWYISETLSSVSRKLHKHNLPINMLAEARNVCKSYDDRSERRWQKFSNARRLFHEQVLRRRRVSIVQKRNERRPSAAGACLPPVVTR